MRFLRQGRGVELKLTDHGPEQLEKYILPARYILNLLENSHELPAVNLNKVFREGLKNRYQRHLVGGLVSNAMVHRLVVDCGENPNRFRSGNDYLIVETESRRMDPSKIKFDTIPLRLWSEYIRNGTKPAINTVRFALRNTDSLLLTINADGKPEVKYEPDGTLRDKKLEAFSDEGAWLDLVKGWLT